MSRKRVLAFVILSLCLCPIAWIVYYASQESQKMDLRSLYWTKVTRDAEYQCAIVQYRSTERVCGVYISQVPKSKYPIREKPKWLEINQTSFPWRMTAKVDGKRIVFNRDVISIRCTDLSGNAFERDFPSAGFPFIKDGPPFLGDFANLVNVEGIFDTCTAVENVEQSTGSKLAD